MEPIDIQKIIREQLDYVNMRINELQATLQGLLLDKKRLESQLQQ
jgi:hypothetical protein